MNDKLSDLRRELHHRQRPNTGPASRALDGCWSRIGRRDEKRNEEEPLEAASALNAPLAAGYDLKEDLRQLWS